MKAGPLSFNDKKFISENAGTMSPADIAIRLQRSVKSIIKYMKDNGFMASYIIDSSSNSLMRTPYWKNLKLQFDDDELKLLDYHWTNTVKQFKADILHTEELQILDMIKMQVLADRSLNQQSLIKNKISELEQEIRQLKSEKNKDLDLIESKEAQIAALYSAYETVGKDYGNLLKEKGNIFKSLKATRDQRYSQIEASKESIIEWIKYLIENPEKRRSAGIEMEKFRLATKVEYERLSEYHTYADGIVEKPILNSRTVKDEENI